jgi:DNA-binding NarL/FixJ family response regulator
VDEKHNERLRIVVADDDERMTTWIRRCLDCEFDIVECVPDGEAALNSVKRLKPDILLLDIAMPVLNGIEAARRLGLNGSSSTRIIFLTSHQHPEFIKAAFAARARGFVFKARMSTDLKEAIHEVMSGRTFVSKIDERPE